jgi:Uma2 family endonuclease
MQLVVENFESMAPVVLHPENGPLTDEEFVTFCEQYPDMQVESTSEGEIEIMPPNYSRAGRRGGWIVHRLYAWAEADGRGECYDSQAGFVLPNGARRAPDASWIRKDRIAALPEPQQDTFYRLCPDFVIELRSPTDRMRRVQAKMEEYIANGAELGWLIDPETRTVWIYRVGREPEAVQQAERIEGEGPVAGFVLDLARVWE